MRAVFVAVVLVSSSLAARCEDAPSVPLQQQSVQNPAIDPADFLAGAAEAMAHRESHRIGERTFLRMMAEPGTVVLDARSREKFDQLHVDGAINLSFPDIAVAELERLLPDKDTRILIYCNNNFRNDERAFPSKLPSASLNLSTYAALYDYGYRNVYELGPNIDVKATALPLVASSD
jgi:hypothetical protein